jgi:hypothetical protein
VLTLPVRNNYVTRLFYGQITREASCFDRGQFIQAQQLQADTGES